MEDGQPEASNRHWNIGRPAKFLALIVYSQGLNSNNCIVFPHFCHQKTIVLDQNTFIMFTTKPAFNLGDLSNSFGSKDIPQERAVKVERDDAESGKLSSSTAFQQYTLILGFDQVGMAFVIKKVIKDELCHNVKFIIDNDELDFNDKPGTICSFMIEKCNVKPEHSILWWTKVAKKVITTSLTEHRNNIIIGIQECTLLGKIIDVMCSLFLIECLSFHTISCFILAAWLLLDVLWKNDGKLPFHKFSTDDILLGIIKTTDEKITYYSGKL
jgi:hypothetical protein